MSDVNKHNAPSLPSEHMARTKTIGSQFGQPSGTPDGEHHSQSNANSFRKPSLKPPSSHNVPDGQTGKHVAHRAVQDLLDQKKQQMNVYRDTSQSEIDQMVEQEISESGDEETIQNIK